MNQELSVELMCVQMRSGVEIWGEKSKMDNLIQLLQQPNQSRFVFLEGEMFNTADIVGIFSPQTMMEKDKRKSGGRQEKDGQWLERGEKLCKGCGQILPFGITCGRCNF